MLRIDEAMADAAVRQGSRIAVLATLPTTLTPTLALLRERAELAGAEPGVHRARSSRGRSPPCRRATGPTHDRLVAAAIERVAADADVVVLAQASMASARPRHPSSVPVLTSLEPGIRRLGEALSAL